jgi:hypothetical protein
MSNVEARNDGDSESQVSTEQTPLLIDSGSDGQPKHVEEPPEVVRGSLAWRVAWAIFAVLVIALFVKGWIDAGSDTDVRIWQKSRKAVIH